MTPHQMGKSCVDQLIEKMGRLQRITRAKEIDVNFWWTANMPYESGLKSINLFAQEVLPAVHEMVPPELDLAPSS